MTRISLLRPSRLLLALLLAAACEGSRVKEPDPEPKAATSAAIAPKDFPAPAAWSPRPHAVGQWVRMAVRAKNAPPSQLFLRVVGKEGDALWYEIESNTPNGTTIAQMLVEDLSRKRFDKGMIQKLRVKHPGDAKVEEHAGPAVAAASEVVARFAWLLDMPEPDDKAERDDVSAAKRTFKGCFVHEIEQELGGEKAKAKALRHPAVPIRGFVRSEANVAGRSVVHELLEMHETGAKSALGPL